MKIRLYQFLLMISILWTPFLFLNIEKCEGEAYGLYSTEQVKNLLICAALFICISFIILIIDSIYLIIKDERIAKIVSKKELNFSAGAVLLLIPWWIILVVYRDNGICDKIIGPGDTGLFLLMLITLGINFWKVKILRNNNKPIKDNTTT